MPGNKNYDKFRAHFHYTGKHRKATHNTFNLRYKILKEISILFHNGSRCDFHFIIKKLVKELEKTQKKYTTFPVSTKKVLHNCQSVKYNIKFIDSFRIMSRSLWNLVKHLPERLHWQECTYCKSYLDYMSVKDDPLIFRSLNCKNQIAIKTLLKN